VKQLLAKNADINAKTSEGSTALMEAVWKENKELVQLLLDAGADLSIKKVDGYAALDLAKAKNNAELMGLLEGKAAK
jgi:ankyrin repeat protein